MLGEWANNLVESFFYIGFMNHLFENKKGHYLRQWGTAIATVLLFINITLADFITVFHWSTALIDCIVIFFYAYLYLSGSWIKWSAGAFLFNVGLLCSVTVSMEVSEIFAPDGIQAWLTFGSFERNLLLLFNKGFLLIYMYIIVKGKGILYKKRDYVIRYGVILVPLITVCMASMSLELLLRAYKNQSDTDIFIALLAGILVLTVIIIYLFVHAIQEKGRIRENQILLGLLDFQRTTFKKEIVGYERIVKTEHDMKNYLLGIRYYMEQKDIGAGLNYLDTVLYQLNGVGKWIVSTENKKTIWGSMINMKSAMAKEYGIEIKQDILPGRYEEVNPLDICVVLGNLLDNAVEAERKNGRRKDIILEMREERGLIYITISNWVDECYRENAKKMISQKRDSVPHGIGLSSVKEVVKKYGGKFVAGMDDNYFRVNVIIPIFGIKQ